MPRSERQPAEPVPTSAGRAPYASYDGVMRLIELLANEEIASPITRSQLNDRGVSPFNQVVLIQALNTMGLIDPAGWPTDRLLRALIDDQHRKSEIRSWAMDFYAPVLQLARQDAAALEIQDEFGASGYRGNTLRKAMAFYLACAADVDLAVSSNFTDIRQRPRAASRQHRYGPVTGRGAQDLTTAWGNSPRWAATNRSERAAVEPVGEKTVIELGDCGRITVFADVRWLQLPPADTARLQDLIQELHGLAGDIRTHTSPAEISALRE